MCLGRMGMTVTDFGLSTLRALFNRIRGYQDLRFDALRLTWEVARMQALWIMAPHVKSVPDPVRFVTFPWEAKPAKKMGKGEIRKMVEDKMKK